MKPLYPQRSNTDLIRWLAIASIAGQLTWLAIVAVGGIIEPGYSEVRDAVSVLGARGVSFILAAAALVLDGPRGLRGWLGPGLIAFTGDIAGRLACPASNVDAPATVGGKGEAGEDQIATPVLKSQGWAALRRWAASTYSHSSRASPAC